jgi:hypothetical protein
MSARLMLPFAVGARAHGAQPALVLGLIVDAAHAGHLVAVADLKAQLPLALPLVV